MKALHATLLTSLFCITVNLIGMEGEKPTSCEEKMVFLLLGGNMERALTAYHVKKRTFKPFALETFQEAKTLFAKKGIIVEKICVTLQDDPHLVTVAQQAQLNGLCVLSENRAQESVCYDACTASSITQFKNGHIYHAIAIPPIVCPLLDSQKLHTVQCGMIEREIARIAKAYTEDDPELITWKHSLITRTAYSLGALVSFYYYPVSICFSAPLGLVTSSAQQEYTELALEQTYDHEASLLAKTTHNLMATLLYSTHSFITERDNTYAQQAYKGKNSACSSMNMRAQRIYNLLQVQERIKKNE